MQLSFSSLITYIQCPKKYWYRYIQKIKTPPNSAMSFGSSIHNTLYKFYSQIMQSSNAERTLFGPVENESPSLQDLLNIYEKSFIAYGYPNSKQMYARKAEGIELLTSWYSDYVHEPGNPLYLETKFELHCGDHLITGRFDRIDYVDSKCIIIDYKTGRLGSQQDVDSSLQLQIYWLALLPLGHASIDKACLYYFEHRLMICTRFTKEQLDTTMKYIEEIGNSIQEEQFEPTPDQKVCTHCDFRNVCERSCA